MIDYIRKEQGNSPWPHFVLSFVLGCLLFPQQNGRRWHKAKGDIYQAQAGLLSLHYLPPNFDRLSFEFGDCVLFSPVWTSCNCIHSLNQETLNCGSVTELFSQNCGAGLCSFYGGSRKKLSLWFIYKPSSRDQSWARSVGCDEKFEYGPPCISQLLIWSELL